jgi:hypothetical protein
MGKRDGNHTPQKSNSIEDSVGNEENGYLVLDPNKTMIDVTKEPSDPYKKIPQRGNLGRNHRETHGEDTRHFGASLPEVTRCTQEISRHKK